MDGDLHKQNIRSELSGFFTQGHTEGTVTGGHFEYDEDTLRGLVTDWLTLAAHYERSVRNSDRMSQIQGPGTDFASRAQAEVANVSGMSYLNHLKTTREFCDQQAQLFQNALDDYLGVEHRNVTEINKSGPQAGI
jgi:hypothetical protein